MTRLLAAIVACAVAAATAAVSANGQRKPVGSERSAIVRVVLVALERDNPAIPVRVSSVAVSTQPTGAASVYSKVAAAFFTGLDAAGNPLDTLYAVLGYSRRFRVWTMLDYGTSDVACDRQTASLFGGRRTAIFKDLGVPCQA